MPDPNAPVLPPGHRVVDLHHPRGGGAPAVVVTAVDASGEPTIYAINQDKVAQFRIVVDPVTTAPALLAALVDGLERRDRLAGNQLRALEFCRSALSALVGPR